MLARGRPCKVGVSCFTSSGSWEGQKNGAGKATWTRTRIARDSSVPTRPRSLEQHDHSRPGRNNRMFILIPRARLSEWSALIWFVEESRLT